MPEEVLTEKTAIEALRDFFREKPFLFFGTGMSCALDARFGMPALKDALIAGIQNRALTSTQTTEWNAVDSALLNGRDLETALDSVNDQDLLRILTEITGAFVSDLDKPFAYRIAKGDSQWPPAGILQKIVRNASRRRSHSSCADAQLRHAVRVCLRLSRTSPTPTAYSAAWSERKTGRP